MDKPEKQMEEFWDWIRSRVKNIQTVINLARFGNYPAPLLQHCKLNQIPHIKRLLIHVTRISAIEEIFEPSLKLPQGCVDQLVVKTEPPDYEDWPIEKLWDLDELLKQFPGLRFLTLFNEAGIDIRSEETYPSIRSLVFKTVFGIYIPTLASSFPNLNTLEIYAFDPSSSGEPLLFGNLTRLLLIGVADGCGEWIEDLSCPRLGELVIDETVSKEVVYAFIEAHSAIRSILYIGCSETDTLSQIAPQITQLLVKRPSKSFYEINHNQTPSFPLLKYLFLDDTEEWMDKTTFEDLVTARFLPLSHPQSRLPPSIRPIRQLMLTVRTDKTDMEFKWSRSELYEEAHHYAIEAASSQRAMSWWQ